MTTPMCTQLTFLELLFENVALLVILPILKIKAALRGQRFNGDEEVERLFWGILKLEKEKYFSSRPLVHHCKTCIEVKWSFIET